MKIQRNPNDNPEMESLYLEVSTRLARSEPDDDGEILYTYDEEENFPMIRTKSGKRFQVTLWEIQ